MKRIFSVIGLFLLLWFSPQTAGAVDETPFGERTVEEALTSPAPSGEDVNTPLATDSKEQGSGLLTALLNMLAALLFVLALIYIIYRIFFRRQHFFRQVGGIRYLGGYPLGPQKSVQLLEIAGKVYVLGVADEVRLLRLIDDPEEAGKVIGETAPDTTMARAAAQMTEQLHDRLEHMKQQRRQWLNRFRRQHDTGDGDGRG